MNGPTVRIYHIPHCSKCRVALALLHERDIAVEVVHYVERPPSRAELRALLSKMRPEQLVCRNEVVWHYAGCLNWYSSAPLTIGVRRNADWGASVVSWK